MTSPPQRPPSPSADKAPPDVVIPPPELRIPRAPRATTGRSSPWDGRRGGGTRRARARGRVHNAPAARQAHPTPNNSNSNIHRNAPHPSSETPTPAPIAPPPPTTAQIAQNAVRDPRKRPEHLRRRMEQNVSPSAATPASTSSSSPGPPSGPKSISIPKSAPAPSPSQTASLSSIIRAIPASKETKRSRFNPFPMTADLNNDILGHPPPLGALESSSSVADAFDTAPTDSGTKKNVRAMASSPRRGSNAISTPPSAGVSKNKSSSPHAAPPRSPRKFGNNGAASLPKSRPAPSPSAKPAVNFTQQSSASRNTVAVASATLNTPSPRAGTPIVPKPMTPLQRMAAESRAKAAGARAAAAANVTANTIATPKNAVGAPESASAQYINPLNAIANATAKSKTSIGAAESQPDSRSEVAMAKLLRDKRLAARLSIQPPPRKTGTRKSLPLQGSSFSSKKRSESIMKPISKTARAVMNRANSNVTATAAAMASGGARPIVPPPKKLKSLVNQQNTKQPPSSQPSQAAITSPSANSQSQPMVGNSNAIAVPPRGPLTKTGGNITPARGPTPSNFACPKARLPSALNQQPATTAVRFSAPAPPITLARQVIMGQSIHTSKPINPSSFAIRSSLPSNSPPVNRRGQIISSVGQPPQTHSVAVPRTTPVVPQSGTRNGPPVAPMALQGVSNAMQPHSAPAPGPGQVTVTPAQRAEMSARASKQQRTAQGTFARNPNAPPTAKARRSRAKSGAKKWQPETRLLVRPTQGKRAADIAKEFEDSARLKAQQSNQAQQVLSRPVYVAPRGPAPAAMQQQARVVQTGQPVRQVFGQQAVIVRNGPSRNGLTGRQSMPAIRRPPQTVGIPLRRASVPPSHHNPQAARYQQPNPRLTRPPVMPPNPPPLPSRRTGATISGPIRRTTPGGIATSAQQVRSAMNAATRPYAQPQVLQAHMQMLQQEQGIQRRSSLGGQPPQIIKKFSAPMAPSAMRTPRQRSLSLPNPSVATIATPPVQEKEKEQQNSAFSKFLARRGKKRGWPAPNDDAIGNDNASINLNVEQPAMRGMEMAPKRRKVAHSFSKLDGPNVSSQRGRNYVLVPRNRVVHLTNMAHYSPNKLTWNIPPKNAVRPGSARSVIYGRRNAVTAPKTWQIPPRNAAAAVLPGQPARNAAAPGLPANNVAIPPAMAALRTGAMVPAQNAAIAHASVSNATVLPARNAAILYAQNSAVLSVPNAATANNGTTKAPGPPVPPELPIRSYTLTRTGHQGKPIAIPLHPHPRLVTKRPLRKAQPPSCLVSKDTWRAKPITPATVAMAVAAKKANASNSASVQSSSAPNAAVAAPVAIPKASVPAVRAAAPVAVPKANVPVVHVATPVAVPKANVSNVAVSAPVAVTAEKRVRTKSVVPVARIAAPKPPVIPLDTVRKEREARAKEAMKHLRVSPFVEETVADESKRLSDESFTKIPDNMRAEIEGQADGWVAPIGLWKWNLVVHDDYCSASRKKRKTSNGIDSERTKQLKEFKELPFDTFTRSCMA